MHHLQKGPKCLLATWLHKSEKLVLPPYVSFGTRYTTNYESEGARTSITKKERIAGYFTIV